MPGSSSYFVTTLGVLAVAVVVGVLASRRSRGVVPLYPKSVIGRDPDPDDRGAEEMRHNRNEHARRGAHQHDPWREAPAWAIEILRTLELILELQVIAMNIAQDLEAGVAAQTTVIASFERFIQNLVNARNAAGNDAAKLAAIDTALRANTERLGGLMAANTESEDEAVASPAVPEITEATPEPA